MSSVSSTAQLFPETQQSCFLLRACVLLPNLLVSPSHKLGVFTYCNPATFPSFEYQTGASFIRTARACARFLCFIPLEMLCKQLLRPTGAGDTHPVVVQTVD